MKEKLEILCSKYDLTASSLAKALGVEASAISHIRSGRNKPSYDFVVKILRAFPDVNPDWLLLDGEEFSRGGSNSTTRPTPLFSNFDVVSDVTTSEQKKNIEISPSFVDNKNVVADKISEVSNDARQPKRVIVLYTDGSFESYDASQL